MAGYSGYRKVPRKVVVVGNVKEGKKLIGAADGQLRILEQQMSFQDLKQGARTIKLRPGVVIECWSCFTLQGVKITVNTGIGKPIERIEWVECFCGCHISQGFVIGVDKQLCCYDFELRTTTYTVSVCVKKEPPHYMYVEMQNTPSAGFSPIEIGQPVVLAWTPPAIEYEENPNKGCAMAKDSCVILDIPTIEEHHKDLKRYNKVVEA